MSKNDWEFKRKASENVSKRLLLRIGDGHASWHRRCMCWTVITQTLCECLYSIALFKRRMNRSLYAWTERTAPCAWLVPIHAGLGNHFHPVALSLATDSSLFAIGADVWRIWKGEYYISNVLTWSCVSNQPTVDGMKTLPVCQRRAARFFKAAKIGRLNNWFDE